MKQPRASQDSSPETALLTELLTAPASTGSPRLQPITLKSLPAQRQRTLRGYVFRNWFDRSLTVAERGLGVAVLGFFMWWFVTGYGYDLWQRWQRRSTPAAVAGVVARAAPQPRPGPPAPTVLIQPYPELGLALPSVGESWQRPVVVADYLQPARPFVPPLPPTATPLPTAVPLQPTATPLLDQRPTRLVIPDVGLDSPVVEDFLRMACGRSPTTPPGICMAPAWPARATWSSLATRGFVARCLASLSGCKLAKTFGLTPRIIGFIIA